MSTYFFATAGPATELDGRSELAETAQDILAARMDTHINLCRIQSSVPRGGVSLERARINVMATSCSSQMPSVVPWPMVRTAVASSAAFIMRRHVAAASSALIAHRDAKRVLGDVRSGCARREASVSAPRVRLRGCIGVTSSPAPHAKCDGHGDGAAPTPSLLSKCLACRFTFSYLHLLSQLQGRGGESCK